jgi:DNA-binding response OmpR family regulator/GAF domain-containing protein
VFDPGYDKYLNRRWFRTNVFQTNQARIERGFWQVAVTIVTEKPRLLVIDRDSAHGKSTLDSIAESFEVVTVRTVSKALSLLRDQKFAAVYVDASQLSAIRWVGMLIQAEEILDAISDGVAVVDPDLRITWANPEFCSLTDSSRQPVGLPFYQSLGQPEILGPDPCPFTTAVASKAAASTAIRITGNRYLRVTVTPVFDAQNALTHLIALTRETTDETQQQLKVNAIHMAGDELADLAPEELAEMGVQERTDLLKYNIARHMKDLLGLDFIEIRLLDRPTNRLIPLLTEGMTPLAANRELYARKEDNGVTGFVAATGMSYVCPDTTRDPLYLEGAAGSRSSLTVPLIIHGTVIGTLNVESPQPDAFDDRDRQFIEIYGRNIAAALNTLELLEAEKVSTASASVEAINRELAIPLDDIITDATTVLDRYAGHDEDIIARLRHLLYRAREIRSLIHKAGSTIAPQPKQSPAAIAPRLGETRILVVDADESIRRSAHHLLGSQGASVETARDAHEAIALMRQTPYSTALVDIRLPDLDGYETFRRLREAQPNVPIILMTGFGWDPSHSIVKARQEGLQTVLYKPFRADRLMEAVEQALHTAQPSATAPSAAPNAGGSANVSSSAGTPPAATSRPSNTPEASPQHSPTDASITGANIRPADADHRTSETSNHEP